MPAPRRRRHADTSGLPSGSFQVIVYAGIDPLTKKPRYIRETLKTYGAAEVALTRTSAVAPGAIDAISAKALTSVTTVR